MDVTLRISVHFGLSGPGKKRDGPVTGTDDLLLFLSAAQKSWPAKARDRPCSSRAGRAKRYLLTAAVDLAGSSHNA